MGNSTYKQQELNNYRPPLNQYRCIYSSSPLSIYRHHQTGQELMQYKEQIHNKNNVDRKLQTFYARHEHPYLVATMFIGIEKAENCTQENYSMKIYYQRAVTNLSKVNDIPFNDSLHCYLVALKGFQLLYKSYGYFQIFESMFHICQKGKLKVWCNQNIYKSVPQQYVLGQGRQEDMVMKILNIVDNNTDKSVTTYSIKRALLMDNRLTFSSTINNLRQICREHKFTISEYLQSLQNSSMVESVLDIYIPQDNKWKKPTPYDTGLTFNPGRNGKMEEEEKFTPTKTSKVVHQNTPNTIQKRFSNNTTRRRSRIFQNHQRPQSQQISRTSQRPPSSVLAVGSREQNDGFPDFNPRRRKLSADVTRMKKQSEYSNKASRDKFFPKVQIPSSNNLPNTQVRQTNLKKRGPKQIPKYPEKIIYQSYVNKVETQHEQMNRMNNHIPYSNSRPVSTNVQQIQQPLIGRSSSNHISSHNNYQNIPQQSLARSRSENNLQKKSNYQERVMYNQPKNIPTISQSRLSGSNIHHYPPPVVQAPPSPKIIFTSPSPSSNLKKSSRVITFPQNNIPSSSQYIHQQAPPSPQYIQHQQNVQYHQYAPQTPHQPSPQTVISYMTPIMVQNPSISQQKLVQSKFQPKQPEVYSHSHQNVQQYPVKYEKQINNSRMNDHEPFTPFKTIESMNERQKRLGTPIFNPQHSLQKTDQNDARSSGNKSENKVNNQRLLTLGKTSQQKTQSVKKESQKSQNSQIPQFESKIFMLDSFTSNKIATNEFLTNQSHALSNIKWEKTSNSGRDSVTSAFRKQILNDLSPKALEKRAEQSQIRKQSKFKKQNEYVSKFNSQFLQTDPTFLDMIRSTTAKYRKQPETPSTYQKKMQKINASIEKKDNIKQYQYPLQNSKFQQIYKQSTDILNKMNNNSKLSSSKFEFQSQNRNTMNKTSTNKNKNAFKKKTDAYLNKNSAISQKWQEQNIMSTSQGSANGKNYLQNLDADILEDMAAYGMDFSKHKAK